MQVKTEHDILAQLSQQPLGFKVPAAKPTLKGSEPYVVLSNGAAACVFEIIPGESPPHMQLQQQGCSYGVVHGVEAAALVAGAAASLVAAAVVAMV
jgi:hypothetical protein